MISDFLYFDNQMWYLELIFITRLLLALLLGGLIGMERQRKKGKSNSAGFRTHILVTVGSCLFMLVSISMPMVVDSMPNGIVNNADPGRIAAQVVSGIGFLGAGAILQGKEPRAWADHCCFPLGSGSHWPGGRCRIVFNCNGGDIDDIHYSYMVFLFRK